MDTSNPPESYRTAGYRQKGHFCAQVRTRKRFWVSKMARMVDFDGFLDLTRLLGGVMTLNLVQRVSNTSVGMLQVL